MRYLLLLSLALWACGAPPKPTLDEETCAFKVHRSQVKGSTYECGTLQTQYEHDGGGGLDVQVPYLLFRTNKAQRTDRVLVYLSGGPGQSWNELGLDNITKGWNDTADTDFLFVEQRGAGIATPKLDCPMHGRTDPAVYIAGCLEGMKTLDVPVAAFNVVEMAYDVENVRALLGYNRMVLSGVSYGTRWALEILRVAAGHVDAAMLDSVVSSSVPALSQEGQVQDSALKAYFDACENDDACKARCTASPRCAAVGSLRAAFEQTLQKLAANTDAKANFTPDIAFDILLSRLEKSPTEAAEFILTLQDKVATKTVPRISYSDPLDAVTMGQYLAVTCSDNQFVTDAMLEEDEASVTEAWRPYINGGRRIVEWCRQFPFKKRERLDPVTSTVPTLLLAGTFDSRTSVSWAESAKNDLSRSKLFVASGAGHQVTNRYDCVDSMVRAFLKTSQLPTNQACISGIKPAFEPIETPMREPQPWTTPHFRIPRFK